MTTRREVMTMMAASGAVLAIGAPGMALAQARPPAHWPTSLAIGTSAPGGVFPVYGQGIASILSDVIGVPTSTQQTQGAFQNVVLVQQRRVALGMVVLAAAHEAWNGASELNPGVQHRDLRALFPMFEQVFQMVSVPRQGRTLATPADFEGRVIGVGPAGGMGAIYGPRWFKNLGINVTTRTGQTGDLMSQLADGRIDAVLNVTGVPVPAFVELEVTHRANLVGFSLPQIETLKRDSPFLEPSQIRPGAYKSIALPLQSFGVWGFMLTHAGIPDDMAYAIVKAVHDNHARLVATHSAASETLPANAVRNNVVPFHPGAARYYREQGINIGA